MPQVGQVLARAAPVLRQRLPQVSPLARSANRMSTWIHALTPSQDQREARRDQHDPRPPLRDGADGPEEPDHRYGVRTLFYVSLMRSLCQCTDYLSSADVIHPAPGAEGRPSFTALVANVDSDTAKYVADCRVQTSRKELIEDLESMSQVRALSALIGGGASDACWYS